MVTETGKGHPIVRSPARQPLYFTLRSAGSNTVNYRLFGKLSVHFHLYSPRVSPSYIALHQGTDAATTFPLHRLRRYYSLHSIVISIVRCHQSSIVIVSTQSLILLFLFSHIRPMPRLATLPLAGVPFRTPGTKCRRRASFAISSDDT